MNGRCARCHRKARPSHTATNADLCHRANSPECHLAERAYDRAAKDVSTMLRVVVNAACYDPDDDVLDSMGIFEFARAIRFLASIGRVRIESEDGACVVGRWA